MYPVEWDSDALYRKYKDVVCYIYDPETDKECFAYISAVQSGDNAGEAPKVGFYRCNEDGYGTLEWRYVQTQQHNLFPTGNTPIKLRPYSMPAHFIQKGEDIAIFFRRMNKSYKVGVSNENYDTSHLSGSMQEIIDMKEIIFAEPYKKTDTAEIFTDCIAVVRNCVYAFDKQIGFVKDEVFHIPSKVFRKLLSERLPPWVKITAL